MKPLLNEFIRRNDVDAPRLDQLGMEAVSESLGSLDLKAPDGDSLFKSSMIGDIVSNLFYFSMVKRKNKRCLLSNVCLLNPPKTFILYRLGSRTEACST